MNIVITGSSGFIGSRLVQILSNSNKFKLLCITRSESKQKKYIKCNLNKIDNYKKKIINFKPDVLIHLAWDKIPNFTKAQSIKNERMSKNLINFFLLNTEIKKIIVAGSCFEIKAPNNKFKHFVKAKKNILKFLKKKAKNNFNFHWLRIFYVYGPGQRNKSIIPHIISSIKNNKKAEIKEPNNRHDFIYIDDVCEAIILTCEKNQKSNILQIGTGKMTSIKKIIKNLEKISKKKLIIDNNKSTQKKNLILRARIKNTKKNYKWFAKISIKDGLKKTFKEYKEMNKLKL